MTPSCRRTCHLRRFRELDIRISCLYRGFRLSVAQAIHKHAEESSNSEKFTNEDRTRGHCCCDCPGPINSRSDCYARGTFFARQQRLKHSPKLQWRTKILGTVMENLPSTSLTYQMFRYRDWPTPSPSKQCWVKKHF